MAIMKKKNSYPVAASETEQQIYALDIGSTYIRLISGIVEADKQIKIQGYMQCPSRGINKGHISDIDSLASQIAILIQEFQNKYGVTIENIVTGAPGCFIIAENQHGYSTVQSGNIDLADRNRAIKNAIAGVKDINESDYAIIHAIPQQYLTEGSDQVTNPIGMYAKRLEVNVHVIGLSYMFKKNIERAIMKTNPDLKVGSIIYSGNAAAAAVLNDAEKEIGVIHIDIGGGTVNVTVFEGKRQLLSFGINDGGNYITKMIAKEFSISLDEAEYLKCKSGVADVRCLTEEQANANIKFSKRRDGGMQDVEEVNVRMGDLADVINRGLKSMCELIFLRINTIGRSTLNNLEIGSGVVLTGGTSKIYGIEAVFAECIQEFLYQDASFLKCYPRVRVGRPIGISLFEGAADRQEIADTDKAVAIGLLRCARFEDLKQYSENTDESTNEKKGFLSGVVNWIRREM